MTQQDNALLEHIEKLKQKGITDPRGFVKAVLEEIFYQVGPHFLANGGEEGNEEAFELDGMVTDGLEENIVNTFGRHNDFFAYSYMNFGELIDLKLQQWDGEIPENVQYQPGKMKWLSDEHTGMGRGFDEVAWKIVELE